jgi:anti-sigma regulatory factor (Ser/Thr protein kinase)
MNDKMDWNEIETTLKEVFTNAVKRGDSDEALKLTDVIASMNTKKEELSHVRSSLQQANSPWGDH